MSLTIRLVGTKTRRIRKFCEETLKQQSMNCMITLNILKKIKLLSGVAAILHDRLLLRCGSLFCFIVFQSFNSGRPVVSRTSILRPGSPFRQDPDMATVGLANVGLV